MGENLTAPTGEAIPQDKRPHGCLIVGGIGLALLVTLIAGSIWLDGLTLAGEIPGEFAQFVFAGCYGSLLVLPFGAVAIFLRDERFRLWRGVALALATAGLYGLVGGTVLSVDGLLPWPGLPTWTLPAVTILFVAVAVLLWRMELLHPPPPVGIALGISLGMVISIPWLVAGALGTWVETWLGLLDAAGTALIAALLMALLFVFEPQRLSEKPFWSAVLAGFVFWAVKAALLAVRGYGFQGVVLSPGLIPAGFVAGALMTFENRDEDVRTWWSATIYLFCSLLFVFSFTEGFEGDWMADDTGRAWIPGIIASGILSGIAGVALLGSQRIIRRADRRWPLMAGSGLAALSLVAGLPIYLLAGEPGVQPEVFFVVLADQADTEFANEITDRDERVTAVYTTLVAQASETQADIRAALDEKGVRYTPYYVVNGLEVEGTAGLRRELERRPDVAYVLNSPHTRPLPDFALPGPANSANAESGGQNSWGIGAIGADRVWVDFDVTGKGIIIGQADTGVDWTHPAISEQYVGGPDSHDYTWFDPWYGTDRPVDTGGHGTHTLGTMLGKEGIGVAPDAQWIACRNLGRNLGNPAYYLDCMQFLFAPFPQDGDPFTDGDPLRGAHVTNNSWGCPPEEGCDGETMSIAVTHLRNAGQMFVVSAGNEGPGCSTVGPPANANAGFSVGAIDISGEIAPFSSRGPVTVDGSGRLKPDVVAPGVDILSSWPVSTLLPAGYLPTSGTSMAGPHVTGLVALLWSANPDLIGQIDLTEQIIIETARVVNAPDPCGGSPGDSNNLYGYGIVDAYAAVQGALINDR